MPPRSKVSQLPESIKAELDKRLVVGGFANYQALSEWLGEQGFQIHASSIHRYGSQFEEKLAALKIATEQARAIAEAAPDDEGLMGDALLRLAQQKAFDVLMQMEMDAEALEKIDFTKLLRGVSDLGKAGVMQKKWQTEARSKLEAKFQALEEEGNSGKSSLDLETLQRIRTEVYGLL